MIDYCKKFVIGMTIGLLVASSSLLVLALGKYLVDVGII